MSRSASRWLVGLLVMIHGLPQSAAIAQTPTEIGYGQNLLADLCSTTDPFTFAADANDVIVAHVVELSDYGGECTPGCCCFDQLIELRDPQNQVLADGSTPMSFNACNSRFRTQIGPTTVPSAGIHSLTIHDGVGGGEYRLFLQSVSEPQGAETMVSGVTRIDVLNQGEVDTFQFNADTGDHVTIEMTALDGSIVEPRIELYGSSGFAISLPTSGTIDVVLDDGGLLTLLAFSSLGQTGGYQLSLEIEPCHSDTDCVDLPCTTAACNPQTGVCEQTVNPDHCLIDEQCFADGDANPGNECEVCESASDLFAWSPAMTGTPCGEPTSDGCTDPDSCVATECVPNDIVCDDDNLCNGLETCDPLIGCLPGTPLDCDDGIPCTVDDCNSTTGCTHTPNSLCCQMDCNDSNPCTIDSCNDGACAFTAIVCVDGNACTIDSCIDGACVFSPISCDDENVCTDDACDPVSGCINSNNTLLCDDGDLCTIADVCSDGACVGTDTSATECDDDNLCTTDSCDATTGCTYTNNTLACNDGDPCTAADECGDGACVGVVQPDCVPCQTDADCDDGEACTNDSCGFEKVCHYTDNADACNEGEPPTQDEPDDPCGAGLCGASAVPMLAIMLLVLNGLKLRRRLRKQ